MTMRLFLCLMFAVSSFALPALALAQDKIGVLMLHGKNPGSSRDPNFGVLQSRFEREGMLVLMPDMPWSRTRYIDGDWDGAMGEMARHVKTLRERGAARIAIVGHSMGCPAAMSYATRHGGVNALVLLAPGHVPLFYYSWPGLDIVRKSIDEARSLVGAGKGDQRSSFSDINQGRQQQVQMTAKSFLSYFDPGSDAEMSVTAPRLPPDIPTLWVIGDEDPLFRAGRGYVFDKLTTNPRHRYLEVRANHLTTPLVAADEVVNWLREAVAPSK